MLVQDRDNAAQNLSPISLEDLYRFTCAQASRAEIELGGACPSSEILISTFSQMRIFRFQDADSGLGPQSATISPNPACKLSSCCWKSNELQPSSYLHQRTQLNGNRPTLAFVPQQRLAKPQKISITIPASTQREPQEQKCHDQQHQHRSRKR